MSSRHRMLNSRHSALEPAHSPGLVSSNIPRGGPSTNQYVLRRIADGIEFHAERMFLEPTQRREHWDALRVSEKMTKETGPAVLTCIWLSSVVLLGGSCRKGTKVWPSLFTRSYC
jgi:hypothetical protein